MRRIAAARAAALILHGARSVELDPRAYERYATALGDAGLDAYLARYFTAAAARALEPKTSPRESRSAYNSMRFTGWSRRMASVVGAVLARPESAGRIGLLGFSLGGFVAAQAAAEDARVNALAVFYGGLPDAMPPHVPAPAARAGAARRGRPHVPLAKGTELVRLARSLGASAEQVTYPGRAHGFDFADKDPMAADAIARRAILPCDPRGGLRTPRASRAPAQAAFLVSDAWVAREPMLSRFQALIIATTIERSASSFSES
jgi:carboxymethylenebutenolidase